MNEDNLPPDPAPMPSDAPQFERQTRQLEDTAAWPAREREVERQAVTDDRQPERTALFDSAALAELNTRWTDVQASFVDEPRRAVQQADALVSDVINRMTESFGRERARLEEQWGRGSDVSTEDLRQALQRYRSFFSRLLAV